jgi:hypothetical protein
MYTQLSADAPAQPVTVEFRHPACPDDLERLAETRYFESRLRPARPGIGSAHSDPVDYLLAFPRAGAGMVARATRRAMAGAAPAARDVWARLTRLGDAWADGVSPISVHVPTIWLELDDLRGPAAAAAAPSVSLCLAPGYQADRPLLRRDPERERRVARAALALLEISDPVLDERLDELFDSRSSALRWIHLSVMLGRCPRAVKLYGWAPREQLLPALRGVGFAGDPRELEALLAELYPRELLGEDVFLDLNLDDYRDPRRCSLGLAAARQHLASGPDRDPLRAALLERWMDRGLCDAAKVEAGHAWLTSGSRHERQGLATRSVADGRFLDLKLVWRTGSEPLAKSYLGLAGFRRRPEHAPPQR